MTIFNYRKLIFIIDPNSSPLYFSPIQLCNIQHLSYALHINENKPNFQKVNANNICSVNVTKKTLTSSFLVAILSDFLASGVAYKHFSH